MAVQIELSIADGGGHVIESVRSPMLRKASAETFRRVMHQRLQSRHGRRPVFVNVIAQNSERGDDWDASAPIIKPVPRFSVMLGNHVVLDGFYTRAAAQLYADDANKLPSTHPRGYVVREVKAHELALGGGVLAHD